jgi:hypothetical protein
MGCDPSLAQRYRKPPAVDFEVEPDGWPTLSLFLKLRTQWNISVGGMGSVVYLGLNYQSAEFLLKIYDIEKQAETMDLIQEMESAALQIMNNYEGGEDGS